jgi:two-component system LytT family sensor kinase
MSRPAERGKMKLPSEAERAAFLDDLTRSFAGVQPAAMLGWLRNWLVVWCGWTALALFFAITASLTYLSTGRPANRRLSIERTLTEWWLWALLTPLVVYLARRFPLDRRWPWRHAAIHLGAGIVVAIVKTAAERAIFAWLTGFWTYLLISTLALQLFVYSAIVAATHGVEYYRRSREREQLEARLVQTRLQLLNVQLQPHFLFNTLNTIAEMVHDDADKADYMITSLSDLLRQALELGATQEISLDRELDLLSRYLDIQRTRFGERLHVTLHVDDEARNASVPVLLLQPLVENAIQHGLAASADAGRIDIEARRAGNNLVIAVTDDGVGVKEPPLAGRQRLGLSNTRERLDALYGSNQRLDLANSPGRGARISVEIPWRLTPQP